MSNTSAIRSRRSRLIGVLLLVGTLLLQATPGSVSAQQSDDGFQGDNEYGLVIGSTLTWDDPWVADQQQSGFSAESLGDYLVFNDGDTSNMDFFTSPGVGSVASNVEWVTTFLGTTYDEAELVETEADKRTGHSVVRFESSGDAYAAYVGVSLTEDLATSLTMIIIGEAATFDDVLDGINDAFALDDQPLLEDVDSSEVLDVIESGDAIPFPGAEDPVEDNPSDQPGENDDKKLPDENDDDTDSTPADDPEPTEEDDDVDPTATEDDDAADDDLTDLGLVDDGTYESPQYGVEVTWSRNWEIAADSLISDTDTASDQMYVESGDFEARFFVSFFSITDYAPDEWVSSFEDQIEEQDLEITIIEQTTEDDIETVFYSFETNGDVLYGMIEAYEDTASDALVVVEVFGPETDIADAFEGVQDDIEIDGAAPFQVTTRIPEIPAER